MNDDGIIHSGHWYRASRTIGGSVTFDEISVLPGTYDITMSGNGGVTLERWSPVRNAELRATIRERERLIANLTGQRDQIDGRRKADHETLNIALRAVGRHDASYMTVVNNAADALRDLTSELADAVHERDNARGELESLRRNIIGLANGGDESTSTGGKSDGGGESDGWEA